MEKFKEYFKVFAYIFYPGMVLILYLAQGLEVLMGLYDDLKVYFYLNNDVSINLFIIIALGLGLAGIAFLLNKSEK